MRRIMLLFVTALAFIGFSFSPVVALAETSETSAGIDVSTQESVEDEEVVGNEENVEDSSNEDEELERVLLPTICGIVGLVGTAALYLLFSGKLGSLKKIFDSLVGWFTKKQEELANEEIDLKKFKEDLTVAVKSNEEIKGLLREAYESNKEQYQQFTGLIEKTARTVIEECAKTIHETTQREKIIQEQYERIKSVLLKMAAGNSELVRTGIADDIIKELEEGKEQ